jgi:hypothetical protein
MTRLTKRRLLAMENALSAMLAGEPHQGDWGESVEPGDLEAALNWVSEQLEKRRDERTSGAGDRP